MKVLHTLTHYSKDYDYLTKNWDYMVRQAKVDKKTILLVDDIDIKEAEDLTKQGYCVRRNREFVLCKKCRACIPDKDVWALMLKNHAPVPKAWRSECSDCM